MARRDLTKAEKYILIGHLLKKGIKNNLVDQSIKILDKKAPVDAMITELMNLLRKNESHKEQEVPEEEIPSIKKTSPSSASKEGTIVIAEKKPFFTSLLKNESISRSYFIIHVENGIPGLKTMQKLMPSIAVIDFDTYSISEQYESLRIIRQQYKNMPILLLCNIIPGEVKKGINQHKLISYIQKPVRGRQLEDVIRKRLGL